MIRDDLLTIGGRDRQSISDLLKIRKMFQVFSIKLNKFVAD